MKSVSFSGFSHPLLLSVLRLHSEREIIAAFQNGRFHGADGFDLHLSCLDPEVKNPETLSRIFAATRMPVMALHYNFGPTGESLGCSHEKRMGELLMAAKAGASAVDMQGYTFDPDTKGSLSLPVPGGDDAFLSACPGEVSLRPEVIEQQKAFIRKIHEAGSEVVLSTHVGVSMNCEQVVSLARLLEQRGADVIKLVLLPGEDPEASCDECIRSVIALKQTLHTRFSLHIGGPLGQKTRVIAPMLGSYLVFCNDGFGPNGDSTQPDLQAMRKTVDSLFWLDR